MVPAEEYEAILNWFYDRSLEGGIELKATCAPHYFRVMRQRRAAERRAATSIAQRGWRAGHERRRIERRHRPNGDDHARLDGHRTSSARCRASGPSHPQGMNAMTKGCLAGTGVCFISHRGEVYPCGYLPVLAGDLNNQSFAEIWENAHVFQQLRNTDN
jgi:MoaA/NifB/PqqE/SkfB family radical SAM enzyme